MRIAAPAAAHAIPFIFAALAFPLVLLQRDPSGAVGEVDRLFLVFAYLTLASFSLLTPLASSGQTFILPGFRRDNASLLAFMALVFAESIFHRSLEALVNIGLLALVYFAISDASHRRGYYRALATSALVLLVFCGVALAVLGLPQGRWLGGIHPNIMGACAVALTFLALFAKPIVRDCSAIVALGVAALVSSRYALVCCAALYLSNMLLLPGRYGWYAKAAVAGAILFVVGSLVLDGGAGVVGGVLALETESRGLGSGLSGRDVLLGNFVGQFLEQPVFGYGFRLRENYTGVHNGFLNLCLEVGLVAFLCFLVFIAGRIVLLWSIYRSGDTEDRARSANLLSGVLAIFVGASVQPQILSFGDPFGLMVLIVLFSAPRVALPPLESP
jgi:hypothetical protein